MKIHYNSCLRTPVISLMFIFLLNVASHGQEVRKLTFTGTLSENKMTLKELNPDMPADWTGYTHLVMEMRTTTPQRFSVWLYRADGTPVRVMVQPFGQNVWLRASLPLRYFEGMDKSGNDLASANNRRTNSFWFSTWGPFGKVKTVEAIGFAMPYPANKPAIEIRSVHLAKADEGSEFLEKLPVLDEFNQWAHADWPGKLKSKAQLDNELAEEQKTYGSFADYNYCELGGYKNTQAKATGFFRVEEINGKWWFVDPHGHLFLSTGSNGAGAGFGGRPGSQNRQAGQGAGQGAGQQGQGQGQRPGQTQGVSQNPNQPNVQGQGPARQPNPGTERITPRLKSWGMTTGGKDMAYTVMMRWPRGQGPSFLGLPDVYAEDFAAAIDNSAKTICVPLKDDPQLLGYFVGNEPAFDGRENELIDIILAGPASATQAKVIDFLTRGDTPARRKEFIIRAFEKYLDLTCAAIKKYDPNHLTLGIRFGGNPSDELLRTGRKFDVCSINVYEYEPMAQLDRVYRYTGRPALIGEFHIGVPANGLGAGLVQAKDQKERGVAYRFYMEQAASVNCFLGAYWFQWRDEPVLGRMDGENYNIGLVDVNDRPYKELVEAIKATNKRLYDVHSGKINPFNQKPLASEAGTPSSPWKF
jgi:hypothetical protein